MIPRLYRGRVVVVVGDVVHVRVAEVSWLSGSWVDFEDPAYPGERFTVILAELPIAWFRTAGLVPEPRLPIEVFVVGAEGSVSSTPRESSPRAHETA